MVRSLISHFLQHSGRQANITTKVAKVASCQEAQDSQFAGIIRIISNCSAFVETIINRAPKLVQTIFGDLFVAATQIPAGTSIYSTVIILGFLGYFKIMGWNKEKADALSALKAKDEAEHQIAQLRVDMTLYAYCGAAAIIFVNPVITVPLALRLLPVMGPMGRCQ